MAAIINIAKQTRSRLACLLEALQREMGKMNSNVADHDDRLRNLERPKSGPSVHSCEVEESSRKNEERSRVENLSDSDYRLDLEHKFGTTGWARKVIKNIISRERPSMKK